MTTQSVKFANDGLDPVSSHLDRLFLFWECYVLEENLLADWHDSTFNYPGRPHHQLFESFLDAWGKAPWTEDTSDKVEFANKSYFQALGVVSHRLIRQMQKGVLGDFLVKEGDTWSLRKDVSPDARKNADIAAKNEIETLLKNYEECRIPSLKNVDEKVEDERDSVKCTASQDSTNYLPALVRMMEIETRCFEIQAHFLREGTVLPA